MQRIRHEAFHNLTAADERRAAVQKHDLQHKCRRSRLSFTAAFSNPATGFASPVLAK